MAIVDDAAPGSGATFGNAGIVANTNLRPVFAGLTPLTLLKMLRSPTSPLNVRWSRILGLTPWFLRMLSHAGPAEVERITRALASPLPPGSALYAPLFEEATSRALVKPRGSLALVRSEEAQQKHWDMGLVFLRQLQVPMEKVDRRRIAELAPAVNADYTHGVYPRPISTRSIRSGSSKASWIYSWRAEVSCCAGHVDALAVSAGRVTGVRSAGKLLEAGTVVVAAGDTFGRLCPGCR